MGKLYQISPESGAYSDHRVMVLLSAAIYRATQHYLGHPTASTSNPMFVIQCKHTDARVLLPLSGPFESALLNKPNETIGIGVLPGGKLNEMAKPAFNTPAFLSLFEAAIQPCLVNQYTRHIQEVRSAHSKKPPSWPAPWQMAWCIRNGLSHGGNVAFDLKRTPNPEPVRWRGLTIERSHQGQPILGNFVNIGDLIILSLDMEESRSGPLPFLEIADDPIF